MKVKKSEEKKKLTLRCLQREEKFITFAAQSRKGNTLKAREN